jgi:hypothetical protein
MAFVSFIFSTVQGQCKEIEPTGAARVLEAKKTIKVDIIKVSPNLNFSLIEIFTLV